MITVTNISDIHLLPEEVYSVMGRSLERVLMLPDTEGTAVFSHNVPCFRYAGVQETKHLYVFVNYGDQTWLDRLAARFPSHKLTMQYDNYDQAWVRVEKVEATPDCVSSRVLHAVRMLTPEFGNARVQAGNPPTTWKELFIDCFRYGQFKYHLPWSTQDKYWWYLFPTAQEEELWNLMYYDKWIPKPQRFYYETIDLIAAATWDHYDQGVRKSEGASPLLLHRDTNFDTKLPCHRIVKSAIALYREQKGRKSL